MTFFSFKSNILCIYPIYESISKGYYSLGTCIDRVPGSKQLETTDSMLFLSHLSKSGCGNNYTVAKVLLRDMSLFSKSYRPSCSKLIS